MKNYLLEKDSNKTKSKTTQLNGYEIIPINSTQLPQKADDEYPFSLSTDKFRLEKEKQFYLSKTNKLNRLSQAKQKPKELIIDTRTPLALMNPTKQKFNFLDYRHKKYRIHKFPFRLRNENKSYEKKNNIVYYNNDNEKLNDDKLTLEQKVRNMKYQFIKAPINGFLPNFALTYTHLPHRAVGNSLYTVLTVRKNQFVDDYNQMGEDENTELPKLKQMQFLLNNNNSNSSPMSSYFGRKDEYRKYVDLLNQPFSYISLLNDDYSISEKMRFQKMMDKLNKVKKCIEEKPDEEIETIYINHLYLMH